MTRLAEPMPTSPENENSSTSSHEEAAPFKYELLKGHLNPDHTWKSDQQLRMEYLQLTDELVQKMTDGFDVTNPETGERERKIPSTVIFLDKSARPLSHLVRDMWPTFAKDPATGEIPPMPRFNFLNIDREQWINQIDPDGVGLMDIDHLRPGIIRSLRSIFVDPAYKDTVEQNGLTEDIDTMPTILDNETVLIVDETFSTGRTSKIANAMLKRAFPTTEFGVWHWMKGTFSRKGSVYNPVPVWYKSSSLMGRGVSDRYVDTMGGRELEEMSKDNYYRKFGKYFLSAPHWMGAPEGKDVRDHDYYQLLREFKELSTNPDVPVMPSIRRDDFDERLLAYNGIDPNGLTVEQQDKYIAEIAARKMAIAEASAAEAKYKW